MKNEVRPIDKSKPSNHRCINCEAWEKAVKNQVKHWDDPPKHCVEAGKDINYWNCCPLFRWNPDKVYKEDGENDTIAADVLRNKLTGEPLTMEQLREMDGQPAWCEEQKEWGIIHIDPDGMWANIPFFRGVYCDLDVKHNGLTLYAYQPAHIDREAWKPCGEMCRNNCATCDHNADEVFGDADYCKDCHRYSKWESSIHKYCERCGRPKTPEAWAELEKRMGVVK